MGVFQFVKFVAESLFLDFQVGNVLLVHRCFLLQFLAHASQLSHFDGLLAPIVFETLTFILKLVTDLLDFIMLSLNLVILNEVLL